MGLDDLQASDKDIDPDSSFDVDAPFTFEDREDARDRLYSNSERRLSSRENHNSCFLLNSVLLILSSSDVTSTQIQNLPDPRPIISELNYPFQRLIRSAAPQSAHPLQDVLTQTDDLQEWLRENGDPGKTLARTLSDSK
jgi:hypothetical protein